MLSSMARPRRSQTTRQELLETGVELLLEQGYHGTGIKDVLDRVGVPKGSFYNYFESKEDFGVEVIRHQATALYANLDATLTRAEQDALSALKRFFRDMIQSLDERQCTGGCLFANLAGELDESEACRRALRDAMKGWRDRIGRALALAQEQGTVRDDLPAKDLACFLLDTWEGAVIRMKVEGSVKPLKQCMARFFHDYLLA